MNEEEFNQIFELSDSDDSGGLDPPKRSLGWRIILMLIVLIFLGVTLAPMGIMMLLYQVGVHTGGGGSEQGIIAGFLILCVLIGLTSIGASNPKVFKYVFWVLLLLGILNASGCAVMLDGLSNIH